LFDFSDPGSVSLLAHARYTKSDFNKEFVEHEIEVWDKMIVAIDQGQLRPSHLRGRKPGPPQ
jgi:hypothetical protein